MAFDIQAAKKAGYSDQEINTYMQQNKLSAYTPPSTANTSPMQQKTVATVNSEPVQAAKKNALHSAIDFIAPKVASVASMPWNIAGMTTDAIQYKMAKDPIEKQKQLEQYNKNYNQVNDAQKTFGFDANKEGNQFDAGQYAKGTTKGALELASVATPVGKTLGTAIKAGAISGAARGASEGEDFKAKKIITGAIGGAVGGGVFKGAQNTVGAIKNVIQKAATGAGNKAAQAVSRATPSIFQRVVEEKGYDLNNLAKKYVPAGSGYDDVLGSISERGNGGVLATQLNNAEATIQNTIKQAGGTMRVSSDDVQKILKEEIKSLKNVPGNQTNVKALTAFLEETRKLYKSGITAQKLLDIKRAADSKFGQAVVDEEQGSVAAQGQKVLANWARKTLKTMFPEIEDALNTQSEVLTFKPILNRARSISMTPGSELRLGSLSNVNLLNPLTYGKAADAALNNPKIASRVMGVGATQLPDIKHGLLGEAGQKAAQTTGLLIGSSIGNSPQDQTNTYQNDEANNPNHNSIIPGQAADSNSLPPIEQVVENPYPIENMQADIARDPENKAYYQDLYDKYYKETQDKSKLSGGNPMSATTENRVQLANSGLRALNQVEELYNKDPNKILKAAIPGQIGARDYDSAAFRAVEGLLRARSGAAIPETEVRRYMNANLPRIGDSAEESRFKIAAFRKDLEEVAASGATLPDVNNLVQ